MLPKGAYYFTVPISQSTGSSDIQKTQYTAHTLLLLYIFHLYLPSFL